jgi:hypothetical protein
MVDTLSQALLLLPKEHRWAGMVIQKMRIKMGDAETFRFMDEIIMASIDKQRVDLSNEEGDIFSEVSQTMLSDPNLKKSVKHGMMRRSFLGLSVSGTVGGLIVRDLKSKYDNYRSALVPNQNRLEIKLPGADIVSITLPDPRSKTLLTIETLAGAYAMGHAVYETAEAVNVATEKDPQKINKQHVLEMVQKSAPLFEEILRVYHQLHLQKVEEGYSKL